MSDGVTIFVCRRRSDRESCATVGCSREAAARCTFQLKGKAEGQLCNRLICEKCAKNTDRCPPHQRFDPSKIPA